MPENASLGEGDWRSRERKMERKENRTENGKETDYTKGSIPRYFAQLTIPLIAGNILQQLYNLIDAMVIGWYAGEEEFAAIGVASSVMNLFLFAIVGACVGISVLLAQLYGAKDWKRFRQEHFLALAFGLGMSLLLGVGGVLGSRLLLKALQMPDAACFMCFVSCRSFLFTNGTVGWIGI